MKILIFNEKNNISKNFNKTINMFKYCIGCDGNQIDILAYSECINLLIKNYYKLKYVLKIIIYFFWNYFQI